MFLKVIVGKGRGEGFYAGWNRDRVHRMEAETLGVYPEIWIGSGGPLRYRLTSEQLTLLDDRMGKLIWPHYVERLHYNGCSFWIKTNRIWKARRKIRLLYYILPTQLRDQLPAVRHALYVFVWAMRRLEGQVHSFEEANRLGVLPGSFVVNKVDVRKCHTDLIRGLVLLEGCLPLSQLNPAMHHFVHYAQYTLTHGSLRAFWMMAFERCVRVKVITCVLLPLTVFILLTLLAGTTST